MVSGSQLQVAKLAQMCPAAPSGTQQRATAPNRAQRQPAAASSAQRWPSATRVQTWVQTRDQTRVQTRAKTQMEHLGAPCSTKCPFKTNLPSFYVRLKKNAEMSRIRIQIWKPETRSDRNLEAPKEPLGA